MKKILIIITVFASALLLTVSCNLEDKFNDPEQTTQGSIPALFTSAINNSRMRSEYWHVRTILAVGQGVYTQTVAFNKSSSVYQSNDGYYGQYWRDYYSAQFGGAMAMYRQMENVNSTQSTPAEQVANEIFFQAIKVILYDVGSQFVDMYGDIPFSEAGSLHLTSVSTPAKFDNQQELYMSFIEELDKTATYFSTAQGTTMFQRQDILLAGDVKKWQKYANSIRLRLLIHISYVNEDYAKSEILKMLNDPAKYPLVDGDNVANYNPATTDILNTPLKDYTNSLVMALSDGLSYVAPDFMLNKLMVPTEDIRLDVMFDKNAKNKVQNIGYSGAPITLTNEQLTQYSNTFSCWDSTTIWQNSNIPGIRITASEVNFIKAEAQQRWGDAAKAKSAYETAVKQSVSFYYYLNSIASSTSGGGFRLEVKPSDALIDKFVTERIAYAGTADKKLELIGTQKWLHFGFLQGIECWTEYRRTKYPVLLPFPSDGMTNGFETPPTRIVYPSDETNYNPNYADVQAKNTRTTKIFWDVK
ncbi:SusD-like starch-binding protein associating with outer membrane [Dysgonomonas alginatilytica]|uniref:SusD-like starch-binding protein associating with outer membrane n=1 Tax=Dysgonomonas alginatilytica TaxID=1605892 RepID=A0A2V3PPL1_9BACT|nr:SusD/RagB family nutrient-binding outer membrane lipoprotein [Dysgonomonas alginatilytica]PXV65059.1 SusD-like starch-binding protein associating with outer membrane [Dysgonomonas alginatilytica]